MNHRRFGEVAAVCAALASGCKDDAPPYDGVRQATIATYRVRDGEPVESSRDPLADGTRLTIEAGGGEFPGVYDGSAWVEFAGVPEGPYVLRRENPPNPALGGVKGTVDYTDLDLREIDVGQVFAGRPDVALGDEGTRLAVTANDMTALAAYDSFEVFSYNVDALMYPPFDGGPGEPLYGDTRVSGWDIPWDPFSPSGVRPLVDPGQGDDLWLTHLVGRLLVADPEGDELADPWSFAQLQTLREAAELSLTAMASGQATTASGAFTPVATPTVAVDMRAQAFAAAFATADAWRDLSCSIFVTFEPGEDVPIVGNVPTLGYAYVEAIAAPDDPATMVLPGDRVFDLSYGNPFSGGTEELYTSCTNPRSVMHPLLGTNEVLANSVDVSGLVDGLSRTIAPTLGLVGDLTIAEQPLARDQVRTDAGASPTITWSPPSLGTPDYYVVSVRTIENTEQVDGTTLGRRTVASYSTTRTTVTIPAGILEPGSYYYVWVAALVGAELGSGPYQQGSAFTRRASGLFTP